MRKLFLIGIALLVTGTKANAESITITLPCGIQVQGVSIDFYEGDEEEYQGYIDDLTFIYCQPFKRKKDPDPAEGLLD